jgi:uncharacterized Tic20 family protein
VELILIGYKFKMENQHLSFGIRFRAAVCHLAGLTWFPFAIAIILIRPYFLQIPLSGGQELYAILFTCPTIGMVLATLSSVILWRRKRKVHPFIDQSGRNAANFTISYCLYLLMTFVVVSMAYTDLLPETVALISASLPILFPLILFIHFCLAIEGTIFTLQGKAYKYLLTIKFFSN